MWFQFIQVNLSHSMGVSSLSSMHLIGLAKAHLALYSHLILSVRDLLFTLCAFIVAQSSLSRSCRGASGWHCHRETTSARGVLPWTSIKLVTGCSQLCLPKNAKDNPEAMLRGWWARLRATVGTICFAGALLLLMRTEKETFSDPKPEWVAEQAVGMQRLQEF